MAPAASQFGRTAGATRRSSDLELSMLSMAPAASQFGRTAGGNRRSWGGGTPKRNNGRRWRPARHPGDAWQRDERLKTTAGGAVS